MQPDLEMKYLKQQERGSKAAKILNDDMVVDALSTMRKVILEKWTACSVMEKEIQHELKLQMTALENFERYFREAIKDGEFAMKNLEHDRTLKARMRAAAKEFVR